MKDRRRNSLSFHVHFWRGFSWERDLFMARITLGFLSISTGDIDTIFKLNELGKQLKRLLGEE